MSSKQTNYYKRYAKKSTSKPYSKYKNTSKLRTYKARSATTMVSRGIRPLAQRFVTSMRYSQRFVIATAFSGLPKVYQFNLNAINDPDRTGVGHQPYGHDTFQGLYQRYRVFAVDYQVTSLPNNVNAGSFSVVPKNDDGSLAVDVGYVQEFPRSKSTFLSLQDHRTLRGTISLPDLTGQTLAEYKGSDRYAAVFGNAPTEIMTLQVYLTLPTTASVEFDVILNYHVELFDPLAAVQS